MPSRSSNAVVGYQRSSIANSLPGAHNLTECESAQLFIERARAAVPRFVQRIVAVNETPAAAQPARYGLPGPGS